MRPLRLLFTSTARVLRWIDLIEWLARLLLYVAREYKRADNTGHVPEEQA